MAYCSGLAQRIFYLQIFLTGLLNWERLGKTGFSCRIVVAGWFFWFDAGFSCTFTWKIDERNHEQIRDQNHEHHLVHDCKHKRVYGYELRRSHAKVCPLPTSQRLKEVDKFPATFSERRNEHASITKWQRC